MDESIMEYYKNVKRDFLELKCQYPFSTLTILPTVEPSEAVVRVTTAHVDIVNDTCAVEEDFCGEYSKELYVIIPFEYKTRGCKIFGAKWIDKNRFNSNDIHFYTDSFMTGYGYEFCVGVPESFFKMKNVLLESIRTADIMLIAYKDVMLGKSNKPKFKAYSHGFNGEREYQQDRRRYIK